MAVSRYFYPRTPCGVRLDFTLMFTESVKFLSTYPVRGTTVIFGCVKRDLCISIHVPRAGYDLQLPLYSANCGISIHVPRAGYD